MVINLRLFIAPVPAQCPPTCARPHAHARVQACIHEQLVRLSVFSQELHQEGYDHQRIDPGRRGLDRNWL